MAFVPALNTAQFNVRQTYIGQQIENTLYFRNAAGWTPASLATAATFVRDWYNTQLRGPLSNQLILREIYAVDLTSVNGPTSTVSITNDPGGSNTTDPMPGSVALCVSFRTANRGRSFRGRNYVAGFCENQVSGNVISSTAAAGVVTAYDWLVTNSPLVALEWVVVSRYANGVQRATAVVTPITDALAVDNVVDSQRRRLPGRGR